MTHSWPAGPCFQVFRPTVSFIRSCSVSKCACLTMGILTVCPCLFICLSVCLITFTTGCWSVCLPIHRSFFQSVWWPVSLSVRYSFDNSLTSCLFTFAYVSVCLCVCVWICQFLCNSEPLSVSLTTAMFRHHIFSCPVFSLSVSICLFVWLTVCLPVTLLIMAWLLVYLHSPT